jgi:hypothetical protein
MWCTVVDGLISEFSEQNVHISLVLLNVEMYILFDMAGDVSVVCMCVLK